MMRQFWVERWNGNRILWQHKPWLGSYDVNGHWRVVRQLDGPNTGLDHTPGVHDAIL